MYIHRSGWTCVREGWWRGSYQTRKVYSFLCPRVRDPNRTTETPSSCCGDRGYPPPPRTLLSGKRFHHRREGLQSAYIRTPHYDAILHNNLVYKFPIADTPSFRHLRIIWLTVWPKPSCPPGPRRHLAALMALNKIDFPILSTSINARLLQMPIWNATHSDSSRRRRRQQYRLRDFPRFTFCCTWLLTKLH